MLGASSLGIGAVMIALHILRPTLVFLVGAAVFGGAGLVLLVTSHRRIPYGYPLPEFLARGIILDRLLSLVGAGIGGYLAAKHENYWYIVVGICFGAFAGYAGALAIGRVARLKTSLRILSSIEHQTKLRSGRLVCLDGD